MKRQPLVILALLLCASCATMNTPRNHRVAPGAGTAANPGPAPQRLTIGAALGLPSPSGQGQREPAVAYGNGMYLVAWREGFNGYDGSSDILAIRLDGRGRPLDAEPIQVCTDPGVQDSPAVTFCNDAFLVAWVPQRKSAKRGPYAIRMRRVTTDGKVGATHAVSGDRLMCHPSLASNSKDEYRVVWQQFNGEYYEVRGARVAAATGKLLGTPRLDVMSGDEPLGLGWARGGRIGLAWTGSGYVVCQSVYAKCLDAKGETVLPLTRTWNAYSPGGHTAAAAWGKGFVFHNVRPFPDPWGWGGNAAIVGMTVTPKGGRFERDAFVRMFPEEDKNRQFVLIADGQAVNALDVSRWFNHPGWPMGMPGGLKHSQGDVWPSGRPAAAYNGESLVVVWPRGHLVDNKRMINRDLYLARVLPDWGIVDRPGVPVSTGPTEETNPVLCAGPKGQVLLAYETLTGDGVAVRYRLITEESDRTPPAVEYVVPRSRTEQVVAFGEPLAADSIKTGGFRIDGLKVEKATFVPGGRAGRRMVLLTTEPPEIGKTYTLHINGVRDRSPAANVVRDATFAFTAKPGVMQRRDNVTRWATGGPPSETYPNPCIVGHRDYIARWNLFGPLPRSVDRHPFEPSTVSPSPGDTAEFDGTAYAWKEIKGEAVELSSWFGRKANSMIYAATYVFSDRKRKAVLRLDSNDHNRAWLNGRLVNDGMTGSTASRSSHDYSDEVPIVLRYGWNRVLLQVENRDGYWFMAGQITDAAGQPMHDLTWQLQRPESVSF